MSQKKKPVTEERDFSKEIKQVGFLENVSQKSLQNIHEAFLREEGQASAGPPATPAPRKANVTAPTKAPLVVASPQILKFKEGGLGQAPKRDGLPKSFFIFFVLLLVLLVFLLIIEIT